MKRIILFTWFFILLTAVFGQITLEKTYNYSTTVVKLETLGYKYYLMDVPNNECRIYNLDHSIFKTINLNIPTDYYLGDIKLVSEHLFDSDDQIELAYTYYKYNLTATSYYYQYGSRIINEDGSIVLTINDARFVYVNQTAAEEYKLFAYCMDYSVFPEIVWTNIYNLPGSPISAINYTETQPDLSLNAFPNPSSNSVRIEYELPLNVNQAQLKIIENNGKTVKEFNIDNHINFLALNIDDLSKGVYFYFIEYNNIRTKSKILIIQ